MGAYDKNLPSLNPRRVARGKYGHVYNQNGDLMANVISFEAIIEFDKQEIKRANAFLKGHRIMGGTAKGKMKFYMIDARFIMELSRDPDATYTYITDIADPDEYTEDANYKVAIKNINFDSLPLMQYDVENPVEIELDFTFDDWEWKELAGGAVPDDLRST